MHVVSGTIVLIFSSAAVAVSAVLSICAPDDSSYWAWILPAMVCATLSIDLIYSLVNFNEASTSSTRCGRQPGPLTGAIWGSVASRDRKWCEWCATGQG